MASSDLEKRVAALEAEVAALRPSSCRPSCGAAAVVEADLRDLRGRPSFRRSHEAWPRVAQFVQAQASQEEEKN